jgi:hypothetical protein
MKSVLVIPVAQSEISLPTLRPAATPSSSPIASCINLSFGSPLLHSHSIHTGEHYE